MRYLLILAGVVVFAGVPAFTHKVAKRRVDHGVQLIAEWERSPDPDQREHCVYEYMRQRTRADAMQWQLTASLVLAGLLFGAASFWVIYDVANQTGQTAEDLAELAADNCSLSEQFLRDEAGDTSREIDVLTAEIVAIQDAIDNTPADVQSVPGYEDAPDWFRVFLDGLLADQVVDANEEILDLRARRNTLETRQDELEGLLAVANCPRSD